MSDGLSSHPAAPSGFCSQPQGSPLGKEHSHHAGVSSGSQTTSALHQELLETSRKEQRLQQERRIKRKSSCLSCPLQLWMEGSLGFAIITSTILFLSLWGWIYVPGLRDSSHVPPTIQLSAPGLCFQWLHPGCVSDAITRNSACTIKSECAHRSRGSNKKE